MIDWRGKARRAGAGSVLREYGTVPRAERWIMTPADTGESTLHRLAEQGAVKMQTTAAGTRLALA